MSLSKADLTEALAAAAQREQKSALKGYIGIALTAVGMIAAVVVWFATREVGINDIRHKAEGNTATIADLRSRIARLEKLSSERIGRLEASMTSEGKVLVEVRAKVGSIETSVGEVRASLHELRRDLKQRRR